MYDEWTFLRDALKSGDDAVFTRIVGHKGSTPRTAGARMVATRSGRMWGTIGGGQVDGAAIKAAADAFETRRSFVVQVAMPAGDAASAGMICGGEVSFLCEYIPSGDHEAVRFFEHLGEAADARRNFVLCTEFDRSADAFSTRRRYILGDAGMDSALPDAASSVNGSSLVTAHDRTYCLDVLEMRQPVFIFGAGHVGKEVSDLALKVDFQSIVLDDREEFANDKRFPPPAGVVLLESFENCIQPLAVDENSSVVIVTRGHLHDKAVLAQALATKAAYIGMIGSRKKRDSIYRALLQDGVTDRDIERVHSPIGLPIDTETPAEIAVSIVGELIDCRAKRKK